MSIRCECRVSLSLADFELLGRLGDGSFSQVLHARHRGSGTPCALKVIDKHLVLRNRQWEQVRTERNVLDRLDHAGVVQLLFTFQDAASLYLGLELCPEGTWASSSCMSSFVWQSKMPSAVRRVHMHLVSAASRSAMVQGLDLDLEVTGLMPARHAGA